MQCGLCGLPFLGRLRSALGCKDTCEEGCKEMHRKCKACVVRQREACRDPLWYPVWPPELGSIPGAFRLPNLPPPQDQLDISACAVNACAAALNTLYAHMGMKLFQASRMFLYYNTRRYIMRLHQLDVDSGCNLRDVCCAASTFGVCNESQWPYRRNLLGMQPPSKLYGAAASIPGCTHHAVQQCLPHILACLLNNQPIVMGMSMFTNVRSIQKDGILAMPREQDTLLGAHAVMLCGYDLKEHRLLVQNCWGEAWANRGFFEVPFDFVLNGTYCWDLWTMALDARAAAAFGGSAS